MSPFIFLILLALLGTQYAIRMAEQLLSPAAEARQTQLGEANICLPETAQASGDYRAFIPLLFAPANTRTFIETFDGMPNQPLSWRNTGWPPAGTSPCTRAM